MKLQIFACWSVEEAMDATAKALTKCDYGEYLTGSGRHPSSFWKRLGVDESSVTSMRVWGIVQSKRDCDKNAGAWKYVGGILKNLFLLVRSGRVHVKVFVE